MAGQTDRQTDGWTAEALQLAEQTCPTQNGGISTSI